MNIKNKTKLLSITDIKPYKNNAKIHSENQVESIKQSIEKYDYIQPICVDKNNTIVIGHGRYEAIKQLNGKDKIEVVDLSYLKPKEIKKLRILDNKIISDEWDKDALQSEIESIYNGFDDIDKIADELSLSDKEINSIIPLPDTEGDDEIPEDVPTITKLGDIWELGRHRLLCGDSTKEDDVNRLMDGDVIDLVHTDPPYGKMESGNRLGRDGLAKSRFYKDFKDDSTDYAIKAYDICDKLKVKRMVWWGANYYCHSLPEGNNWFVWDKRVEEKQKDTQSDCELAWVKSKWSSVRIFRHLWKGMMKDSEKGQKRIHPTQKPIALVEWVFEYYKDVKNVMDLFLGSGSTLIGCEKTNRICYGMELDEHYCDVIVQRYIDFCTKNDINIEIKRNGKKYNTDITR
jgi:DNA modification methylase